MDSYALTLWTFLQSQEAEYFSSLMREVERIDGADMITRGFINGIAPIAARAAAIRQKMFGVKPDRITSAEMLARAKEQWARHHQSRNPGVVS